MTIQKKLLLDSLKMAMPAIETGKPTLQGADTFVFHNGKIFSYNDLIAVHIPLATTGLLDSGIEGAVHADEFYKVISKFSGEEINFEPKDKTWLLTCGKAKAEMTLMEFDFKSRLDGVTPDENSWVKLPLNFIEGIGACKMSVNKSPLSGVFISENVVFSTDGYQINKFRLDSNLDSKIWISDDSANELLKIQNLSEVQLQNNWVHFKTNDGVILSLKTLNAEKYPFDKLITLMNMSTASPDDLHSVFPVDLFSAIDRANSFAIDISEHSAVRLVLSNDGIEVSAERSSGKYNESVAWTEPLEKPIEAPVVVYVDAEMMSFMSKRALEFYLVKGKNKIPRLLFVSNASNHLMATFAMGE